MLTQRPRASPTDPHGVGEVLLEEREGVGALDLAPEDASGERDGVGAGGQWGQEGAEGDEVRSAAVEQRRCGDGSREVCGPERAAASVDGDREVLAADLRGREEIGDRLVVCL